MNDKILKQYNKITKYCLITTNTISKYCDTVSKHTKNEHLRYMYNIDSQKNKRIYIYIYVNIYIYMHIFIYIYIIYKHYIYILYI